MANDVQNKLTGSANSENSTTSFPRTKITPPEIEVLLKPYAQFISRRVRKYIPRNHIPMGELDDEIKDITQTSLIKFWLKLTSEKTHIATPKSYMSRIAFSQCIDVARLNKLLLAIFNFSRVQMPK